jgi:putative CocE/NonD family hydrolase
MRDGVFLSATVYLPPPLHAPAPAILIMTPYTADNNHARGMDLARRGFPTAILDCRGRGNSGGCFRPFSQEALDGFDAVEWLAAQAFCNGKVGMRGGSYCGYLQWAIAKEFPPHLATIVPTAAPHLGLDFPMRNNIKFPYSAQWLAYVAGSAAQKNLFADQSLWSAAYRSWHESGTAFSELPDFLPVRSPAFSEWLSHPEPDAFWDACNPSDAHYARIEIPVLTITGLYDDDQPGALEHYRRHLRAAPTDVARDHYLIIGPWDHAGSSTPARALGGIHIPEPGLLDLNALHAEWFAWTMAEGERPAFLEDRVSHYVMERDEWRHFPSLDGATAGDRRWFPSSRGSADDLYRGGMLAEALVDTAPDSYTYDPCDAKGLEIEAEAHCNASSLTDQSILSALSGKALFYTTPPFHDELEISGFMRFEAWIGIDCPDTDIFVTVFDVDTHGGSTRIAVDARRARYRNGVRNPMLIDTPDPRLYIFDSFTFASRLVRRGHRLRLVIAPMGRLMETIFAEKNYNGGGVVAKETALDGRPVIVRLFHDSKYPSALIVPTGQGARAMPQLDASKEGHHKGPSLSE